MDGIRGGQPQGAIKSILYAVLKIKDVAKDIEKGCKGTLEVIRKEKLEA